MVAFASNYIYLGWVGGNQNPLSAARGKPPTWQGSEMMANEWGCNSLPPHWVTEGSRNSQSPPHTWRQNGVFDSQPLLLYPPPLYFHELSSMFNDFLSHGLVIFKQTIIFMRRVGGNENPLRLQRRGGPPARAPWPLTFRFESEPCIQLFCVSWCVGTAMLFIFCCGHRLATLSPKN